MRAKPLLASMFLLPLALAAASGAARADMVVIASTAPGVAPGTIMAEGEALSLPEGSAVTLLAGSGETLRIEAPGGIVGGAADAGAASDDSGVVDALASLVMHKENGSRLGAIRGVEGDSCQKPQGDASIAALVEAGCTQEALAVLAEVKATLPDELYLGTAGGNARRFGYGEPIVLELQASFDAFVYCFHEGSEGLTTRILPLESGPTPHVTAGETARLPGRLGQAKLEAGAPAGLDRIHCFATDTDLAAEMPLIFGGPATIGVQALDGPVRTTFDKLYAAHSAEAGITIEIVAK